MPIFQVAVQIKMIVDLISPLFSVYYNRFRRIYYADIGSTGNKLEDSINILLYMMAFLSTKDRNKILENNNRLEDVVIYTYRLCLAFNKHPESLKFKNNSSLPSAHKEYFANLANLVNDPFRSGFIRELRSCLDFEIELNDEFLNAVLRSYIQHELLHHIIEAPFNSYGEQFTILISAKLNLDSCSNEWKCYYKIIKKSKFIQAEWKLKSDLYNQNILSENQSFLLSKLKYLTDKVLAGENVKPKRLKSKKLSIYPENEPLC